MSITKEKPIPRDGPWRLRHSPVFGVVGGPELGERLSRVATVKMIAPRTDVADVPSVVDAVLIQLSAFEPGIGPWAYGLQPEGYDRGRVLTTLVREACSSSRPVLVVDDVPAQARDGWQSILLGTVDDVAPLGPVVDGGLNWNPGVHWDAVAWARPVAELRAAVVLAELHGAWVYAQRLAVASGTAVVDVDDPWESHLAVELAGLGVIIRDAATGETLPVRKELEPHAALDILCRRLGLDVHIGARSVVVLDDNAGDVEQEEAQSTVGADGLVTTRSGLPSALVSSGGDEVVLVTPRGVAVSHAELAAARVALERTAELDVVVVGDVVAARGVVARASAQLDGDLHTLLHAQATRRSGVA